jgi:tetratricopeptide (TPR) repeat protein
MIGGMIAGTIGMIGAMIGGTIAIGTEPTTAHDMNPGTSRMRAESVDVRSQARILAGTVLLVTLMVAWSGIRAADSHTMQKANSYVTARDWDGLLRYSLEWTRAEPGVPMAWFYLGNAYGQALKKPEQAQSAFERAVALQPKWPAAWNALGFVHVELKQYDKAIEAFTHAVEQAPTRANYWNSLAAAYSYQNRLSQAVKTLEEEQRAIAGSDSFVDWYNLGNGFCTLEEFKNAAAAYRRALQLKPDYGPAWNNLGTIEGVAGNTQAALNDYQRASALGDQSGAVNYRRLQQAIVRAKERNSEDPLQQLWRSQAADLEYRTRQAWQERLARAQN